MKKITLILLVVCGVACYALPLMAEDTTQAATPAAAAAVAPAAPAPAAAPAAAGEEETDIVAGKVTAVDAANNALTVTDEAGKSSTVTATKEETSIWKGDNTIELAEVKVDDSVELEYYKGKDGKLVAIWIDVLTKEAAAPAQAQPAAAPAAPAPAAPVQ
ncbi:MAG: hypothetical protein WCG78_05955 [Candidatus Omnitrophota bacterium]